MIVMLYSALLINWRDVMQNLKVKVSSVEESKEVQELFFELGGVAHDDNQNRVGLVIFANNIVYADFPHFEDYYTKTYSAKEITIPQLKDMVVLKRNSIEDATHGVVGGYGKYYLTPSSFYEYINGYWECVDEYVNGLEFFKLNDNDLPFIDSEESLNDKVASAEEARQEMKVDNVNNPSHYNKGGIECIEAIKASMTHEAFCGYLKGNILKYTWRYEVKGGAESLQKAQWYTNRLLEELSNG